MPVFSTTQVAKRLGLGVKTLSRYIAEKKIPPPRVIEVGKRSVHIWTESEIERLRKLLPKIANGRKTRYQKKQSAVRNQRSAKTRKKKKPKT